MFSSSWSPVVVWPLPSDVVAAAMAGMMMVGCGARDTSDATTAAQDKVGVGFKWTADERWVRQKSSHAENKQYKGRV